MDTINERKYNFLMLLLKAAFVAANFLNLCLIYKDNYFYKEFEISKVYICN